MNNKRRRATDAAPAFTSLEQFFEKSEPKRTQEWLAEKVGIDRSTISLIVSGKRQPSVKLAIRIAAVTGVPIESLRADLKEAFAS